ncbi:MULTISPECIES: PHA/PHB synthase family protein [unclassified Candidatus Tisiphia]|uniref:PHA/PHB synthase family protein n=1 Tax=unclassified Candidatus Tisiphia TaxID=2996318 RepID=UPI001E812976|nr:MAG: class I poly(R)-hydroxyalkanoic acid synthase [Rickettsia endosymbiont of Cimex lectularius]
MDNISSDEIIKNIKKVSDKYQEIILCLMQGRGNMIPASLIDMDKNKVILSSLSEQFIKNPEKFWQLNIQYVEKFQNLVINSVEKFVGKSTTPLFSPNSKDRRFKDLAWQDNAYFDFVKQFYLMSSEWLQDNIEQYELAPDLKQHLAFMTHQFINAFSPSNFAFGNPIVLSKILETGGQNLVQGLENFLADIRNSSDIFNIKTTDNNAFLLGKNIATTKGKIVFQNQLIQLICYEPKQKTRAIPLLIIPPCINKYYILDLSEHNSMVAFLVEHNFQVYMVSWVNPDETLADKSFEDYVKEGVLEACEYIMQFGYNHINAIGYCIGGTFLATAIAYLKANNLNYINSVSFITALLDFKNPGEVSIFVNESSIAMIEQEMNSKGYFDGRYLSNSFSLLRANDLVWSFFVNNYLLGQTPIAFDLLYWNADPTNLPTNMYSYYLRNMYLNNLLKEPSNLSLFGTPVDLSKIDCNSFFLAANDDHIAPWRSVYEGLKLLKGNKTFCLTSSGHVAGVVNPPATSKYNYKTNKDIASTSESWFINADEHQGSWWSYWLTWLEDNSGELIKSIDYGSLKSIELAPGKYVHKRI